MSLVKLTNAPFDIEFNGKPYTIKKATLSQVIQFLQRADQYTKEGMPITQSWIKLMSYALFLLLSPSDSSLTEEFIANNIPGDCDSIETLTTLGFIKPVRTAPAETKEKNPTTEPSSQPSPTVQDGPQPK